MAEEKTWNQQLCEWYKSNGCPSEKVKSVGLPHSTFGDYIKGRAKDLSRISLENKKKLYSLTGMEIFKVDENQQNQGSEPALAKPKPSPQKKSIEKVVEDADTRVKEIAGLFYDIMDKLDYFKDCPEDHRKKLTSRLAEEDIGYLTSLLTSIYNPSKFKAWVLTTNYRPRRKYG